MRTQRLIFTFLCGLLLVSFSGCSGGGAGSDSSKRGGDSSKSGGNLAPSRAWLDNYGPRACAVAVDGESKRTIEPFASLDLEIAPGAHTFVLTCEEQPAETLKADIPPGKNALVRAAAAGDYLLLTCTYTATGPSAVRGGVRQTPAPKSGVIIADYGPREEFPDTLKSDEGFVGSSNNEGAKTATRTRLIRSLPVDPELAELEYFIFCDYRIYGVTESPSHCNSVIDRIKRLEPRKEDPAVSGLFIRVLDRLAHPPAPDELRRRVVVLALQRPVKSILNAACAILADKDFLPNEEMAEALAATLDQLNPDEGDNGATIRRCSSCLVDAFYRNPAVVARPKTRRFLARFAHPQLEPTLVNARYALIDGRCASDLVPIYTHFARDARIEMVERLVTACRKREAVSQDAIELNRAALTDEDTEVRITAAKALPQLAAFVTDDNLPAFQDLLARALGDPSVDVQREAARALEAKGFVPTEQIADQLVAVWRQLDATDPQGRASREQLAKSLKTSFEKNPGVEADRPWRQRILAAFAQQ